MSAREPQAEPLGLVRLPGCGMRGRLLLALFCLAGSAFAYADTWTDLWSTHEQQAQKLLDSKRPEAAAPLFNDGRRRAYAELEAGQYAKAAKSLAPFKDADSQYNRGNALAHTGHLREALNAYEAALAASPGDKDVIRNRDLVKRALQQQQNQSGQQGGSDGQPGPQGSKGGQSQGGNHSPGGGQPQPGGQSQSGSQQASSPGQSQSGGQQANNPSQRQGQPQGGDQSQGSGQSQGNNPGGGQAQNGDQSQDGGQQPGNPSQASNQALSGTRQRAGQSQSSGNPPQPVNQSQARNQPRNGDQSQGGGAPQAANQPQGAKPSQAGSPTQGTPQPHQGATRPGDDTSDEGALAPNGQQTNGSATSGTLNAENAKQDAAAALRYRQSQPGQAASDTGHRGTASVLSPDGKPQSSADMPPPKPPSEQALALDQWLRGIPDDSAELLRRKFLIEHMLKQQRNDP